jgi:hypothetical protein
MKNRYLLLLGFFAFACPIFLTPTHLIGMQAPAQTFTVTGTITRAGTAEPIQDVQISASNRGGAIQQNIQSLQQTIDRQRGLDVEVPQTLLTQLQTQQAALRANPPVQLNAMTDRDGHFVLQNLPAGQYTLQASREGYFGPPNVLGTTSTTVQMQFVLTNGQAPPAISISMVPGAAISGNALDSEGHPVVGAQVQAYRVAYQNGLPMLQSAVNGATTDDRGAYRVFRIPPGDYYLEITPQIVRNFAGAARGAAPPKEGLVRTFYPDALDAKSGKMISLRGGEDMTGTAIAVRTSPLSMVSGTVVSNVTLPKQTGFRGNVTTQSPTLMLVPHDRNALETNSARGSGNANMDPPNNGQFQLNGVPPGSYDLYARVINNTGGRGFAGGGFDAAAPAPTEPNYYFGRASIEVGFQDIQGVTLVMNPGVELKAFATIDGSAAAAANRVRIGLTSADSGRYLPAYAPNQAAQVTGADGMVTIPFVYEGTYRFTVNILPNGAAALRGQRGAGAQELNTYVEDIREGGVSVFDNGLVVGKQAPQPIEIIVKTNGGMVEGDAYDNQQQLKSGATVVLAPVQARRQNTVLFKMATSNAMGHFTLRGIQPGQYKLFAFDSLQSPAFQNAEFLSKYEERSASITVNATATTNAQVTVIKP